MQISILLAILFSFLLPLVEAMAEDSDPVFCAGFDTTGLTEGKPVIRVEPSFGDKLRNDSVESCVVVTYGLKEKRGTDGKALLAQRAEAIAWSDDVPRSARRAAERVIPKWLFFSKMHSASDDLLYFSVFTF